MKFHSILTLLFFAGYYVSTCYSAGSVGYYGSEIDPADYYTCPTACSTDPCSCDEAGPCKNDTCSHANGCDQCVSGNFKKDYDYPCVGCTDTFGGECLHCTDFLGCQQCDEGYTRYYDDDCELYFCIEDGSVYSANYTLFEGCPVECENDPCSCNEVQNCQYDTCHSNGCDQCEDGYFKKDYNYHCVDCQEFASDNCLHCTDFLGCQQCEDETDKILDEDCGLYICDGPFCEEYVKISGCDDSDELCLIDCDDFTELEFTVIDDSDDDTQYPTFYTEDSSASMYVNDDGYLTILIGDDDSDGANCIYYDEATVEEYDGENNPFTNDVSWTPCNEDPGNDVCGIELDYNDCDDEGFNLEDYCKQDCITVTGFNIVLNEDGSDGVLLDDDTLGSLIGVYCYEEPEDDGSGTGSGGNTPNPTPAPTPNPTPNPTPAPIPDSTCGASDIATAIVVSTGCDVDTDTCESIQSYLEDLVGGLLDDDSDIDGVLVLDNADGLDITKGTKAEILAAIADLGCNTDNGDSINTVDAVTAAIDELGTFDDSEYDDKVLVVISLCDVDDSDNGDSEVCDAVSSADPSGDIEVVVINVGGSDTSGQFSCLVDDGTSDDDYFEYDDGDDASGDVQDVIDEICEGSTDEPTPAPTDDPTEQPTAQPSEDDGSGNGGGSNTDAPTPAPTSDPTPAPTSDPTPAPTDDPTPAPTDDPTPAPTSDPTPAPTSDPTPAPTSDPTPAPTDDPTPAPTNDPTPGPTGEPTPTPTGDPTPAPTDDPTPAPTDDPTPAPTSDPTPAPTSDPTPAPTDDPTPAPTDDPTPAPTNDPTPAPTEDPTPAPTSDPTPAPTDDPTPAPTDDPTPSPTNDPTPAPTSDPTPAPTEDPTPAPTDDPTSAPTPAPTTDYCSTAGGQYECPPDCDTLVDHDDNDSTYAVCTCDELVNCGENTCHDNGCDQCKSGYIKRDWASDCYTMEEIFGATCKNAQELNGCTQCEDGYVRTIDSDCGVHDTDWYYCMPEECADYEECGETAFAYVDDTYSFCFIDDEDYDFSRWGWSNGHYAGSDGINTCGSMYAGAGKCDLNKGTLVGSVCVTLDTSGSYTATFQTDDSYGDYNWDEFHFYIGSEPYPTDSNGDATVAPGQYTNVVELDYNTQNYVISGTIDDFDTSKDYYWIAHSVTCGVEDDRRRRRMAEAEQAKVEKRRLASSDYPTYTRELEGGYLIEFAVNDNDELVWNIYIDDVLTYQAVYDDNNDVDCDDGVQIESGATWIFYPESGEGEAELTVDLRYADCEGVDNEDCGYPFCIGDCDGYPDDDDNVSSADNKFIISNVTKYGIIAIALLYLFF